MNGLYMYLPNPCIYTKFNEFYISIKSYCQFSQSLNEQLFSKYIFVCFGEFHKCENSFLF